MLLWRVSDFTDLSGLGGTLADGRWHHKGSPIVYTAESSALALLEVLVSFGIGRPPIDYQLLMIEAPDNLECLQYDETVAPAIGRSRTWGEKWLSEGTAPLARVPSAIAPHSCNILLNPASRGAQGVSLVNASRWPWDKRLFR